MREINDAAWDKNNFATQAQAQQQTRADDRSSGTSVNQQQSFSSSSGARQGYDRMAQPQRTRDDATVSYFYQRPGGNMTDAGGQFAKQRWAVGDDSVLDQVRSASDVSRMTNEFNALDLGNDNRQRNMDEKLWDQENDKDEGAIFNQWSPANAWTGGSGLAGSNHSVSQPIMMQQRRQLSPGQGNFQGQENAVMSPRSDTSGLGLSMAEYVLASSPQGKELDGKLHRLKPFDGGAPQHQPGGDASQQAQGNGKKSKTPSPFEVENKEQEVVENGIDPVPQNKQEEDPNAFSRTPGSRNASPTEQEKAENLALQQPVTSVADIQRQNMMAKQPHHPHPQQPAEGGGAYMEGGAQNPLQIDTGAGGMENVAGMEGLQFDYAQGNQMAHSMDSPSYINYDQSQQQQMFQQRQPTPQTIAVQQLTPQQQYALAAAQQQQLAFANPYIIAGAGPNPQDPYALGIATVTGAPAVVPPQYAYGVTPWSTVYPMGILPQNIQQQQQQAAAAANQQAQQGGQGQQQRGQNGGRPMTPSQQQQQQAQQQQQQQQQQGGTPQGQEGQMGGQPGGQPGMPQPFPAAGYQVITYYDQTGALINLGQRPGMGGPVRLVSPAPVIVSGAQTVQANGFTGANGNFRMMSTQSQQQAQQAQAQAQAQQAQAQGHNPSSMSLYTNSPQMATTPQNNGGGIGTYGGQGSSVFNSSALSGSGADTPIQRRDSLGGGNDYKRGLGMSQFYGSSPQLGSIISPTHTGGSLTPPPSQNIGLGLADFDNLLTGPGATWSRQKSEWGNRALGTNPPFGMDQMSYSVPSPGAEMKYRSGSTSSSTSGSGWGSNTLFPPRSLRSTAYMEKSAPGRSRLLEDFRNNRFPNLQLRDLVGHIVEFSQDQHGSRFIQQKLERATPTERQMVFSEILGAAYSLMTDVFGNYVIQKFFEFGLPEQKQALAQRIRGHVLPLALQMYGCRVIQKALESIPPELQVEMVKELDGHVLKCVKDQNGNHVVQKCIECVEPPSLQFIVDAFRGQVYSLSTHPYGCRVIQRILEHCVVEQTKPLLDELHSQTESLVQDQYGNYVIQHVLEHGRPEDKSKIVAEMRGKVLVLSQHKFASNVVEKCITHSSRPERALLIDEVCSYNDGALYTMMKDQYANYVVQKMIDVSEPNQRKVLMHKIRPYVASLRKYTYGKHILAKLEKFFMKSNDLGPIGGPTNGAL